MDNLSEKEVTILTAKRSPPIEDVECHSSGQVKDPEKTERKRWILYAVCACSATLILAIILWAATNGCGKGSNAFDAYAAEAGFPELEMGDTFPLGMCQGDCDANSDCDEGLVCFQRDANEAVPGCEGGLEDYSRTDYCTIPTELEWSDVFPLGLCQGDCDANSDCGEGLVCFQRDENEEVPGCDGGLEDSSRTDYCILASLPPTGPTVPSFEMLQSWEGERKEPGNIVGHSVCLSKNGRVLAYSVSGWDSKGYVESFILDEEPVRLERVSGYHDGAIFGPSVALSNDGRIMAVGTRYSTDRDDADSGVVQVFELDDDTLTWSLFALVDAPSLDEDSDSDVDVSFGHSVSLSEDDMVLAVGSPHGYDRTSVFRLEDNEYIMMGNPIRYGESSYGHEGWSVSLSSDGLVVAVGAPTNEEGFDEAGAGRVYEFIDGEWEQRGRTLLGAGRHDLFGTSMSLSGDGNTVAIGSINNDSGNGENYDAGHVRIYEYNQEDSDWIILGEPILGEEKDRSGISVSLTDDGKKVAIGAIYGGGGAGQVRIFEYNEEDTDWHQVGPGISDEAYNAGYGAFGSSVSFVDASGHLKLAVGAPETVDEYQGGLYRQVVGEAFLFQEMQG